MRIGKQWEKKVNAHLAFSFYSVWAPQPKGWHHSYARQVFFPQVILPETSSQRHQEISLLSNSKFNQVVEDRYLSAGCSSLTNSMAAPIQTTAYTSCRVVPSKGGGLLHFNLFQPHHLRRHLQVAGQGQESSCRSTVKAGSPPSGAKATVSISPETALTTEHTRPRWSQK